VEGVFDGGILFCRDASDEQSAFIFVMKTIKMKAGISRLKAVCPNRHEDKANLFPQKILDNTIRKGYFFQNTRR